MARPKSFDPEQALASAMQLFWRQGYEATSLSDLESELGIGRKSLYDTFGNKRQLFLQALGAYTSRRPPVEGPEAGWAELVATFNSGPPYHPVHHSCFIVNTTIEMGVVGDRQVGQVIEKHNADLRAGFQRSLERAIAEGDAPKQDTEAAAMFLTTALHGLSVMGRAGTPVEQLHAIATRTLAAIQSP